MGGEMEATVRERMRAREQRKIDRLRNNVVLAATALVGHMRAKSFVTPTTVAVTVAASNLLALLTSVDTGNGEL